MPVRRGAVIVTSDKCYAPSPAGDLLREDDPLGGNDPYSASKSCAEIVTASWRESFFGVPTTRPASPPRAPAM